MGIQDRDYMKRRPDEDGPRGSSAEDTLDEMLSGFLARHPRFFLHVGIGLALLIVAAIVVVKIWGRGL